MKREEAIKQLSHCEAERYCSHFKQKHHCYGENNGKCNKREALDMAIEALQTEPTKAVPPSLADVYKWERDIALSQLEEYGIGFAEKKRDDLVEVVRCKDCRYANKSMLCSVYLQPRLPSDFCNYGERGDE